MAFVKETARHEGLKISKYLRNLIKADGERRKNEFKN